jgi:hypothetical protein
LQRVADDHEVEAKQVLGQEEHRPYPGLEILGGRQDPAARAAGQDELPGQHVGAPIA